MFKNHLLVAIRNLWRNKGFSIINIFGLSIGLAATILLFLYIFHELSFDRFHSQKNRIYRVHYISESEGVFTSSSIMTAGIGPSIIEELPEVQTMMRFSNPTNGFFTYKDKNYHIRDISYVDSSFFTLFDFTLLEGNAELALDEPFTVVLCESTVQKIFGDEDPIGKVISLNNEEPLNVTGVFPDFPSNSHLQFQALVSFTSLYQKQNMYLDWNGGHNYYTYVLLNKGADPDQLKARFPAFLEKHINYLYREVGVVMHMDICKLTDVHLYADVDYDINTKGSTTNIIIFTTVALFILLIACINYMNLATARALRRAREVGIRKVVGARRSLIIRQFIGESVLISLIALLLALLLIRIFQADFNMLIGKTLALYTQSNLWIIAFLIGLSIIIGVLAGSYPAFYVSRFRPVLILKGSFASAKGKPIVRNILVIIQFFISASLIICTLIIYGQLAYIKDKDLGYNAENVMILEFPSKQSKLNLSVLRSELSKIAGVEKVAAASDIPGWGFTSNGYMPEGYSQSLMFHALFADEYYLNLLDIPVLEGRMFDEEMASDKEAYLINETLAHTLGWEDPIGKTINRNGPHKVIGVVQDFHFAPLHQEIEPLIITLKNPGYYYNMLIKYNPGALESISREVEKTWFEFHPDEPFNSFFLNVHIANVYQDEAHFARVFLNFSILAIFIACMGLLGLAALSTEQRRKEIGIRKVLGASFGRILFQLSYDFTRWVLLANILAIPAAWFFMDRWLQGFAYSRPIGAEAFIISLLGSLLLAWITIAFLVAKVSRTNAADVLKYE
ncbi:MAG: ABC transporter permease [Bacteroidota bacterium]|nr:ABC transporter permease [Bacteroidota bacterium]